MPRAKSKQTTKKTQRGVDSRYRTEETIVCHICHKTWNRKGFKNHMRSHDKDAVIDNAYVENANKRAAESPLGKTPKRGRHGRQADPEVLAPSEPLFGEFPLSAGDVLEPGPSAMPVPASGPDDDCFDGPVDKETNIPFLLGPLFPPDTPTPLHASAFPERSSPPSLSPSSTPTHPPVPDITPPQGAGNELPSPRQPHTDDIKVEYHRASGRPTVIYPFEEFKRDADLPQAKLDPLSKPWRPFRSRLDFEFATLAHEAHLNKGQVTRLLGLIKSIASEKEEFSFATSDDVDRAWERASVRFPLFSETKFTVDYKGVPQEFSLHSRSLWDWVLQQVKDPLLAQHFRWDAQRLSKYDGEDWVRFYDEPWTASKFAAVQAEISKIHPDAKPLAIILWADTSKISTFGTQKGHFIVARIGNLPGAVRNSTFFGGGRIVGFLPIVDEDPKEKKKPAFVNFKNAVYHEAFRLFLEEVARWSHVGYHVTCGDEVTRMVFPYIHIISADYEEHCRFALNRGLHGNSPCPVCHIRSGELANIRGRFQYRVNADAQDIVNKIESAVEREEALQEIGMRDIKNAIWTVALTDVHEAISFDRLHAYIIGLWKNHLFEQLKTLVVSLGRPAQVQVNELVKTFPRWSKLKHFKDIFSLEFADGNKWEQISKIIIHVTHQLLTPRDSKKGFALLRLIRKWQELNVLVSLDVQTEKTLKAYDQTLIRFHDCLQAYERRCVNDQKVKNWNGIIKLHSQVHAVRDIRLKGVVSNMDTKPNEKLNGAMRDAYHQQTNFKNVEVQLGRLEDRSMVCTSIKAHMEALDAYHKEQRRESVDQDEGNTDDEEPQESRFKFMQIELRSLKRPVTISAFVAEGGEDPAFTNFPKALATCLRDIQASENLDRCLREGTLPRGLPPIPQVKMDDLVVESQYIRVNFESKVTWKLATDLLRCSPKFHGAPRYDCVIAQWQIDKLAICELVRVFSYNHTDGVNYGCALIQPFDIATRRAGDAELGLCRVRKQARDKSAVIPIRSVIRGAIAVADKVHPGEYTVMDMIDGDMYLRLITMFPDRDMETDL